MINGNKKQIFRAVAVNLLLIALVIFPLWFAVTWIVLSFVYHEPNHDTVTIFVSGYIFVILELLLAGIIQQSILLLSLLIVGRWGGLGHWRQWLGRSTAILIPFVLAPISTPLHVQFDPHFLFSTILSILIFMWLMRIPDIHPNPPFMQD